MLMTDSERKELTGLVEHWRGQAAATMQIAEIDRDAEKFAAVREYKAVSKVYSGVADVLERVLLKTLESVPH